MIDSLNGPLLWTVSGHVKGVGRFYKGDVMSMRWRKPSGQIMVVQDNEETEAKMNSMGFEKLGKESVTLEDPEPEDEESVAETCEITEDEIPEDLPMSDPTPHTSQGKEKTTISPDDVGEMPKSILDG